MRLEALLTILAEGNQNSGCNPAAARKAGNVCGRPPKKGGVKKVGTPKLKAFLEGKRAAISLGRFTPSEPPPKDVKYGTSGGYKQHKGWGSQTIADEFAAFVRNVIPGLKPKHVSGHPKSPLLDTNTVMFPGKKHTERWHSDASKYFILWSDKQTRVRDKLRKKEITYKPGTVVLLSNEFAEHATPQGWKGNRRLLRIIVNSTSPFVRSLRRL